MNLRKTMRGLWIAMMLGLALVGMTSCEKEELPECNVSIYDMRINASGNPSAGFLTTIYVEGTYGDFYFDETVIIAPEDNPRVFNQYRVGDTFCEDKWLQEIIDAHNRD